MPAGLVGVENPSPFNGNETQIVSDMKEEYFSLTDLTAFKAVFYFRES